MCSGACLGLRHVRLARQAEEHARAAGELHPRELQRIVPLLAGEDQDAEPRPVEVAHRRPQGERGAGHLVDAHRVRHVELGAAERRGFVAGEEDARVGDVLRRRQRLADAPATDAPLQEHLAEEVVRGRAVLEALSLVHGGEYGADPLALDRARKHGVDADSAGAELLGQLLRQGVQRGLGNDVGAAREIRRVGEDGGDVHHRPAARHQGSCRPREVPGDAEDVAHRIGDGLALAAGLHLRPRQRDLVERLLGSGRPGIVDQDVDPAEDRGHLRERRTHRLRIAAIEHGRHHAGGRDAGFREQLLHGRVDAGLGAARHDEEGALPRDVASDLAAEVPGRAGEHDDLARQAPLLRCLRRLFRFGGRAFHGHVGSPEKLRETDHALRCEAQYSNNSSRVRRPMAGSAWLTT